MANPPPARGGSSMAGALIGIILLAVSALLFAAIYFVVADHFWAFVAIGILALVFALGAYLSQAATAGGGIGGVVAYGYLGFGFALLVGDLVVLAAPGPGQFIGLAVVLLLVAVAIGLIAWRRRAVPATQMRLTERAAWAARPAGSAFDYPTAQSPAPKAAEPAQRGP